MTDARDIPHPFRERVQIWFVSMLVGGMVGGIVAGAVWVAFHNETATIVLAVMQYSKAYDAMIKSARRSA